MALEHHHRCKPCGLTWEHDSGGAYDHTCPGCGRGVYHQSWWRGRISPEPEVTVCLLPIAHPAKPRLSINTRFPDALV